MIPLVLNIYMVEEMVVEILPKCFMNLNLVKVYYVPVLLVLVKEFERKIGN